MSEYYPGIGCHCCAHSENECCCQNVDWRSEREVELEALVENLEQQVAHLSLYKPARRTEQQPEPVKAIGPCNEPFWFGGIVETDEEFAERAGTPYEQDA